MRVLGRAEFYKEPSKGRIPGTMPAKLNLDAPSCANHLGRTNDQLLDDGSNAPGGMPNGGVVSKKAFLADYPEDIVDHRPKTQEQGLAFS